MRNQEFYATPGAITDPGEYGYLFDDLPNDIPSLCRIIQGLMLHVYWAEPQGIKISQERQQELGLRRVSRQLKRILELDPSPLATARPLERKLVGNCRDFSTLMTAILRHKGIPARARCGFGTYFWPDKRFEDHWVCQYWNADEKRWVMFDAQLDAFQQNALHIDFDALDMPEGTFVPGGDGWLMCREDKANPDDFGILNMHGLWFVAGNLIRDLLSLNKTELLPWDMFGSTGEYTKKEALEKDYDLLDKIAAATRGGDPSLVEVKALCANKEVAAPPGWEP